MYKDNIAKRCWCWNHFNHKGLDMPDLLTVGPDEIIKVWRDSITHTFKGERCVGGPFEQLFIQFYGARTVQIDIRKNAFRTCVPGLIMLRDELTKIIDEYTNACPTCHRTGK